MHCAQEHERPITRLIRDGEEANADERLRNFVSDTAIFVLKRDVKLQLTDCLINVVPICPRCPCRPRYLGQPEDSPVCHFCPSLWADKSGQCSFSVHRISLFLLLFAPKDLAPFSIYICPTKNPLLAHKLSILQLNQATFEHI